MLMQVCCLVVVAVTVSGRVVHQADGIVSIITELEPEHAPVAYLQAVDRPPGRARPVPLVAQDSTSPPLQEGEFRVRSEKITVVDPETGFKVVHLNPAEPEELEKGKELEKPKKESERRSGYQASASDVKVSYPSIPPEDLSRHPSGEAGTRRFGKDSDRRNEYQRQRKRGQFRIKYPKRDNTVRTEKTTRIRNEDEPTKVYKEIIVRPVTEEDDIGTGRKYGKTGRYGKYNPTVLHSNRKAQRPGRIGEYSYERVRPTHNLGVGEVTDSSEFESGVSLERDPPVLHNFRNAQRPGRVGGYTSQRNKHIPNIEVDELTDHSDYTSGVQLEKVPDRKKTQKEYSSRTVVKYPDGYAHGNEKRVESSSKYKTGSNSKNNYKAPSTTSTSEHLNRKYDGRIPVTGSDLKDRIEVDQPLQEEGTYISSDIADGVDDGLVDDGGGIYSGGGYRGGYGEEFDKEKHFEKEKGKEYVAAHKSAHGGKAEKGHQNEESFAKGKSEKHGHDENKGYAVEKEGDKKSHLDKASQFAEGHQSSEGEKDNDYHKEKGHRKGHKKSGFRTVHHKDEFKKNEEFYDEEHSSGNEQKHGHQAQKHHEQSGGQDKKAHLDSGYHKANRGHEGGHEKGHGFNQQKGFSKEKGHAGHYGDEQEYGKKSGFKEGESHGHSEHGGHGHHGDGYR